MKQSGSEGFEIHWLARRRRRQSRLLVFLLAFAPACRETNTVTGPPLAATPAPTRTPTPTPAPSVDVSGSWRGTFTGFSAGHCYTRAPVQATAQLRQNGSAVEGFVSSGCFSKAQYAGTIQGHSLVLSAGPGSISIRGTATESHIEA